MAEELKDFKELVKFVTALANGVGDSLEDGKFSITEILKLLPAVRMSKEALDGIENIPSSLLEAEGDAVEDLRQWFIDEFDIPQDQVEAMVERAWNAAFYVLELIRGFLGK